MIDKNRSELPPMPHLLHRFVVDEAGEEAIEYGLLASLVVLAIVGSVTLFASNATAMWQSIASHI